MTSIEIGSGSGLACSPFSRSCVTAPTPFPVREMTYLFIIAALPVMNSAGTSASLWPQLLIANLAILAILLVLEKEWGFHYETSKRIVYEKIELIHPERRAELLADLEARTGLKIKRVSVGKVDFLHDTADLMFITMTRQDGWLQNGEVDLVADQQRRRRIGRMRIMVSEGRLSRTGSSRITPHWRIS